MFDTRTKLVILWNEWKNYLPWTNKDINYCHKASYKLYGRNISVAYNNYRKKSGSQK